MTFERILLPPRGHLADANARSQHPADKAAWIWHPDRRRGQSAVLRFRRRFSLAAPISIVIHVTGDQRFQLRCDGEDVSYGPDRCDLEHWTVQSIRCELPAGGHEFEAIVWWIAEPEGTAGRTDQEVLADTPKPPMAQMTWRGGFLLCTDDLPADEVNTGIAAWTVEDLSGAVHMHTKRIPHYFDVGPAFDFDLDRWRGDMPLPAVIAETVLQENAYGVRRPGWCLYPATIPEQKRAFLAAGRIRTVRNGWDESAFSGEEDAGVREWQSLLEGEPLTLAPQTSRTVLWDLGDYVCGYADLNVQGGTGSVIEFEWAEALYEEVDSQAIVSTSRKGNRDEIAGKSFLGFGDAWKIGRSAPSRWPTLWWRAGRYVRLRVWTGSEPLTIARLGVLETGYPLDCSGEWRSSDARWDELIPLFVRSFQCSAHETWTDTPYYEQMCYVGDTMMHVLSNYTWFPDDRISRRAIEMFDWSRRPSGLVAERYPSAWRQECATYSMLWPLMVRDFAYWRDDFAFVKRMLPGLRGVMSEFEMLQQEDGLLHEVPGWPWVDWVPDWAEGCGPGVREGDSSIVNLHWVRCLQAAADVEEIAGDLALAERCRGLATKVFETVLARYWDAERGLMLDTAGDKRASEHAQFFALLTGLLDETRTEQCLAALRSGEDMARATISAAFYLLDALYRHGEEEEFHHRLGFWRELPGQGFSCTPEAPEPSRSDAHAWGSHPAWHSFASIAGIRPAGPGFRRVRVEPLPGAFESFECKVVHPRGHIAAAMRFSNGGVSANVTLPAGVTGEFYWQGRSVALGEGETEVRAEGLGPGA